MLLLAFISGNPPNGHVAQIFLGPGYLEKCKNQTGKILNLIDCVVDAVDSYNVSWNI